MSLLARRDDDRLRLSSRAPLPRSIRSELLQAIGQERARVLVQLARLEGLGVVGGAAITVTDRVSALAEQAACRHPEDRARTDAIADVLAASCMRLIEETAR